MAMNGDDLGKAIANAVNGLDLSSKPAPSTEDIWKIVANVLVNYMKANIEVTTDVSTTVASGIAVTTAGSATAQVGQTTAVGSGSGTGTGTIK